MNATFSSIGWSRRRIVSAAGLSALAVMLTPRFAGGASADRPLRAAPATLRLRGPSLPATDLWAYEGAVPGPTLRVARGEEVKVRLVNDLTEPTAIHWQGLRVPSAMDGVPYLTQPPVMPGQSFDYRFIARDAGTFFYRAPYGSQRDRGLGGPLIVDEVEPVAVDRDVVLMLDDWAFDANDIAIMANGLPDIAIPVRSHERIRLRLINAATCRFLPVTIGNLMAWVMAIDGQPAEPFVARGSQVTLAPGNRLDLFVDSGNAVGAMPITVDHNGRSVVVARLMVEDSPAKASAASKPEPKPLPDNPLPTRIDLKSALRIGVGLQGNKNIILKPDDPKNDRRKAADKTSPPSWTELDHTASDFGAPMFQVQRGRPISLAFTNETAVTEVIHVHGHSVRLLDNFDDGWKPFWLDTLPIAPRQTARMAFTPDQPGKWLIERQKLSSCETLVSWFQVT